MSPIFVELSQGSRKLKYDRLLVARCMKRTKSEFRLPNYPL